MPARLFNSDGSGRLAVAPTSWTLGSVIRAVGIGALAFICGLVLSWGVARLQGRMIYSKPGLVSASSGLDLWFALGLPLKERQMFRSNGWVWEERRHPDSASAWCIRREVVSPTFLERYPPRRPPYWSTVPDELAPESTSRYSLAEHYEAGFGWPLVCLVSEVRYRSLVDDAERRPLGHTVEVLHGVPWRQTVENPLLNWEWARWPWVTFGSGPATARVISQTVVIDGVSQEVISQTVSYLPSRLVWMGMIGNALFYALCLVTALWLLRWGLRCAPRIAWYLHRHTRAARSRRGECCECGYPLAGLSRCPECGAVAE